MKTKETSTREQAITWWNKRKVVMLPTNENEIWKDILEFENTYQVSNLGNVKSKKTNKILSINKNKNGYCSICLFKNGKVVRKYIHRLVAQTFVLNPDNKTDVNHIDGIKSNNTIQNLQWVTKSENTKHAVKNNLIKYKSGENHHFSKLNKQKVTEIREKYNNLNISKEELSKEYNLNYATIWKIIENLSWKDNNYIKRKTSWNRKEVEAILRKLADDIDNEYRPYTSNNILGWGLIEEKKWIEQNL